MKYIILVLWTFSLFLLMFSSFPFRVECRPTRAMGPGPPYMPGTGVLTSPQQYTSSSTALGLRGSSRLGLSSCPVMEGPSSPPSKSNPWPELNGIDITVKVWDTPLVLEGMARSRSEVRSDGTYGVTFDLIRVVKGDAPLLRRRKQFRLQFLDNPSSPSQAGNHSSTAMAESGKSTALIITRTGGGSGGATLSSSSTRSSSSNHVNTNQQHHHNYNRALGLRSNSNNSNNQRHSQLGSSHGARVSNSGAISLKSSNLHSNYVNLPHSQQQQQQILVRRGYATSVSSSSTSRVRNNLPLSQTVQFNQQYNRNYNSASGNHNNNNFTIASGSRSKNSRIARSHQLQQHQQPQQYGGGHPSNYENSRHARHGRVVVGQHNNFIVNSASGGGVAITGKCLPPRATVKTGRKYFVFAAKVENHFVAVFSPELANKRNTKAVESILCKGCGKKTKSILRFILHFHFLLLSLEIHSWMTYTTYNKVHWRVYIA